MGTLDGKVAFITDAARGLGGIHAIRLAERAQTSSRLTSARPQRSLSPRHSGGLEQRQERSPASFVPNARCRTHSPSS